MTAECSRTPAGGHRRPDLYCHVVSVREAVIEDAPAVHRLIRELAEFEQLLPVVRSSPDDLIEHVFGPAATASVVVAEADDEIVGFALYFFTYSTFLGRRGIWLEDLYVRPAYRCRGYGRALLERVRGSTDGRVEWSVLNWNTDAMAFYESIGAESLDDWTIFRWQPR